jgi:hypothetical protein
VGSGGVLAGGRVRSGVLVGATVGGVVGRGVLSSGGDVGAGEFVATRGVDDRAGACVETAGPGDEARELGLASVAAGPDVVAGGGVVERMPGNAGKSPTRPSLIASLLRLKAANVRPTAIDGPSKT